MITLTIEVTASSDKELIKEVRRALKSFKRRDDDVIRTDSLDDRGNTVRSWKLSY